MKNHKTVTVKRFFAIILSLTILLTAPLQAVSDFSTDSEIQFYDPNACSPVTSGEQNVGAQDESKYSITLPEYPTEKMVTAVQRHVEKYYDDNNVSNGPWSGNYELLVEGAVANNINPFLITAIGHKETKYGSVGNSQILGAKNSFGRKPAVDGSQPELGGWYKWDSWKQSFDVNDPVNKSEPKGGDVASFLRIRYLERGFDTLEKVVNQFAPSSDNNDVPLYISQTKLNMDRLIEIAESLPGPNDPAAEQQPSQAETPTSDCVCSNEPGSAISVSADISENIPDPWRGVISEAAAKYTVNPNFIAALYLTENGNIWKPFNTNWASSSEGASGPMQFIPDTWTAHSVDGNGDGVKDINNVPDAVHSAANLVKGYKVNAQTPLGSLQQPFKRPLTLLLASASYNWGPGNVSGTTDTSPITASPTETQNYLKNIYELMTSDLTKGGHPNYGQPNITGEVAGEQQGGSTTSEATLNAQCASGGAGGGIGSADGFTFPLKTTKAVIKRGAQGGVWCYANTSDNCHHNYNAADVSAPTGTTVIAAIGGRVGNITNTAGGNGSRLTIDGDDDKLYYYAHLGVNTIKVTDGQTVTAGQELGAVGTAADAQGSHPHLHIDTLPANQYSSRVSCASESCRGFPFIPIQPLLAEAYKNLPEN